MLAFLLQCCGRARRHRRSDTEKSLLYQPLFPSNHVNNSYIPINPFSSYNMSMNSDLYSGKGSFSSKKETNHEHDLIENVSDVMSNSSERNIRKNYIINQRQNYYLQRPSYDIHPKRHSQEIQRLPGPTVITINMAAERVTEDLFSEVVDPIETQDEDLLPHSRSTTARYVPTNSSLFHQHIIYENQPNIYFHQLDISNDSISLIHHPSTFGDETTTSEMSGSDSESIYETVRVFVPKRQSGILLTK